MNSASCVPAIRVSIAVLLCVTVPMSVFAATDGGYKVAYDGGSIPDTKAGTGVKLYIDSNRIRVMKDKTEVVTIPASSVTEISYGQDVHRRVGAAIGLAVISFGIGRSWHSPNRRSTTLASHGTTEVKRVGRRFKLIRASTGACWLGWKA